MLGPYIPDQLPAIMLALIDDFRHTVHSNDNTPLDQEKARG